MVIEAGGFIRQTSARNVFHAKTRRHEERAGGERLSRAWRGEKAFFVVRLLCSGYWLLNFPVTNLLPLFRDFAASRANCLCARLPEAPIFGAAFAGAGACTKQKARAPRPRVLSDDRRQLLGRVDNDLVLQQLLKIIIVCTVIGMHVLTIDQTQKAAKFGSSFSERPAETGEIKG